MNTRPPENPADRLLDEISRRGWTQTILSQVIGRNAQAVSEIINGKKEITRVTALQFGAALDSPAEEWRRLQDAYRFWELEQDSGLQSELAMILDRAKNVKLPVKPVTPVYEVKWSDEHGKHVATVDQYPELVAYAGSAEYAVRKLRGLVATAKRASA